MSKKADSIYNNMLMPNQTNHEVVKKESTAKDSQQDAHAEDVTNVAQGVPNLRVRRKYSFVNWLMSGQNPPLQSNSRFPVTEEEIIHYSAIVEIAHGPHAKY